MEGITCRNIWTVEISLDVGKRDTRWVGRESGVGAGATGGGKV